MISETGEQLGILSIENARNIAKERVFDLVEVSPYAKPPVCRLMDYGKYKYLQSKKDRDARKKAKSFDLKEVKMRPKIGDHDFQVKLKMVQRLLSEGDKVKVSIIFRGREVSHSDLGRSLLEQISKEVEELGNVEVKPKLEGKNMIMVVGPLIKN